MNGRCTTPDGTTVPFLVHDDQGGSAGGPRVFAGLRSDPFFIDLGAIHASMATGRLAFKEVGTPTGHGADVFGIVVEVPCESLLRAVAGPLVGIVGETVVAGKLPVRLERVGRPEVKNVFLAPKDRAPVNRDLELRDLYNLGDAFHLSGEYRGAYRARLHANLAYLDSLDGATDWPLDGQGAHTLTELLLQDYLIVDLSKPFAEDGFFEIERAAMQGRAHATCGGRTLNHDTMDTLYTLTINAERGPRIRDGVDGATVPAGQAFPYLAPPNLLAAMIGATR